MKKAAFFLTFLFVFHARSQRIMLDLEQGYFGIDRTHNMLVAYLESSLQYIDLSTLGK